tara:strand:+ start:185 stop:547 length:363 start_codon:yes stop_codon:yes gene_type:complete
MSIALSYAHSPSYTHLATALRIAENPDHSWTVEEIVSGKYDAEFKMVSEPIPNLNFTTSTYWVKLRLTNAKNAESEFYPEVGRPLTNVINLYRERDGKPEALYKAFKEFHSSTAMDKNFA